MIVIPDRHPIRFSLSMEMSRLTRDGTAEPVSRDQILTYIHTHQQHGEEDTPMLGQADAR